MKASSRSPLAALATAAALTLVGSQSAGAAQATIFVPLDEISEYDRDAWSQEITDCDRLAAHYDDPEALTEGVGRSGMDKPAARAACQEAVKKDPDNPRLNYQMGRAYGYSDMHDKAIPYREKALRAGYPQSLFVMGYIRTTGWDGAEPDPCYGGELIRRSAEQGRFAGLVGFPHYASIGTFDACEDYPKWDDGALLGYLKQAEEMTNDFYKLSLIKQLRRDLESRD